MSERPVKVPLVSPLPPPEGGVATWTQRLLHSKAIKGVTLFHLDSSIGNTYDPLGSALPPRITRSLWLLLKFLWVCLCTGPSVIHHKKNGLTVGQQRPHISLYSH
jgi:hypothetical protein